MCFDSLRKKTLNSSGVDIAGFTPTLISRSRMSAALTIRANSLCKRATMCSGAFKNESLGVDYIREEILIGVAITQRVSLADLSATKYPELHRLAFNELSCASRQPTALPPASITP